MTLLTPRAASQTQRQFLPESSLRRTPKVAPRATRMGEAVGSPEKAIEGFLRGAPRLIRIEDV